jgi:hypothetical protein
VIAAEGLVEPVHPDADGPRFLEVLAQFVIIAVKNGTGESVQKLA